MDTFSFVARPKKLNYCNAARTENECNSMRIWECLQDIHAQCTQTLIHSLAEDGESF